MPADDIFCEGEPGRFAKGQFTRVNGAIVHNVPNHQHYLNGSPYHPHGGELARADAGRTEPPAARGGRISCTHHAD